MQDRLAYLDFADVICLLSQRYPDMERMIGELQKEAENAQLKVNVQKPK